MLFRLLAPFSLFLFLPVFLLPPPPSWTTKSQIGDDDANKTNEQSSLAHMAKNGGRSSIVEERVARLIVAPSFARENKTGSIVCLNNCFGSEHFISSFCSSNMDHPLHIVAAKAGRQLRNDAIFQKCIR